MIKIWERRMIILVSNALIRILNTFDQCLFLACWLGEISGHGRSFILRYLRRMSWLESVWLKCFNFLCGNANIMIVNNWGYSFVLGGFQLGQSASGDELKHWLLMVKSPDQWIDMWHKLKPEVFSSALGQRDSQTSR